MRERTRIARKYEDMKIRAASLADGALNYAKRLPGLNDRFDLDFENAVQRITVIARGLVEVYGYADPLPIPDGTINYFDACVLWTRRAINFLIAFSRRDQGVSFPISLRALVGDNQWSAGAAVRTWVFNIPPQMFPSMTHVRIRGISAVVVRRTDVKMKRCRGEAKRLWQLTVTPPLRGMSIHLDRSAVVVDQKLVPSSLLARVQTRNARRDPDVVGMSSMHNASPIGEQWKVEVIGSMPSSAAADFLCEIGDIQLDFNIVFRRPIQAV
jgi:hypothetical protein